MAKILILGESGSGKTTSIGNIPELNIQGLNPQETFIIACTNKELPFRGWKTLYTPAKIDVNNNVPKLSDVGNYYQTNVAANVASLIKMISSDRNDIKNIITDDLNYVLQDYYMANAKKGGYDVYKNIGLQLAAIFDAINFSNKNIIVLAHHEEFKSKNNDTISYRMKTVGNMVNNYITPAGKFSIVLFADQIYDENTKTTKKVFVTNYDGNYPAKSPVGMFKELYIPNDLGYVLKAIEEYENTPIAEVSN